jgi:hypothetical protein
VSADEFEQYSYLWDGSDGGWVLLQEPDLASGYCIFNVRKRVLLHLDNEGLNTSLCERMKVAGAPVLASIPPGKP